MNGGRLKVVRPQGKPKKVLFGIQPYLREAALVVSLGRLTAWPAALPTANTPRGSDPGLRRGAEN